MSRIRSVHPGLFTDEAFVSLSAIARVLFIGLWTECDDFGSFEWRPTRLKMRILPADNVVIDDLLDEMIQAGFLLRYELDGREYGAVRNFCKFQRPKKANSFCPQTDAVRHWCGNAAASSEASSPPVPNRFPTGGEKSPQKGGREEGRKGSTTFPRGGVPGGTSRVGGGDDVDFGAAESLQ